jgi:hypothetical protein
MAAATAALMAIFLDGVVMPVAAVNADFCVIVVTVSSLVLSSIPASKRF